MGLGHSKAEEIQSKPPQADKSNVNALPWTKESRPRKNTTLPGPPSTARVEGRQTTPPPPHTLEKAFVRLEQAIAYPTGDSGTV
jgi:hypothetical protein